MQTNQETTNSLHLTTTEPRRRHKFGLRGLRPRLQTRCVGERTPEEQAPLRRDNHNDYIGCVYVKVFLGIRRVLQWWLQGLGGGFRVWGLAANFRSKIRSGYANPWSEEYSLNYSSSTRNLSNKYMEVSENRGP